MSHIANSRHHGFGKGFLKNHADAIEKCGRVPGGDEEFVQVPPRDTVKRTQGAASMDIISSDNAPRDVIPTSSLVRIKRKGAFSNINASNNGFPPSERSRSTPGMNLLQLKDEEESVYVSANSNTHQDVVSNGLSSPDSTSIFDMGAIEVTETRFPDMGPAVQVKEEEPDSAEEPATMWIDTIPSSAMSMPAQQINDFARHDRAMTTCPERKILTSPRVRKRHASTEPDSHCHFSKKFC